MANGAVCDHKNRTNGSHFVFFSFVISSRDFRHSLFETFEISISHGGGGGIVLKFCFSNSFQIITTHCHFAIFVVNNRYLLGQR